MSFSCAGAQNARFKLAFMLQDFRGTHCKPVRVQLNHSDAELHLVSQAEPLIVCSEGARVCGLHKPAQGLHTANKPHRTALGRLPNA